MFKSGGSRSKNAFKEKGFYSKGELENAKYDMT